MPQTRADISQKVSTRSPSGGACAILHDYGVVCAMLHDYAIALPLHDAIALPGQPNQD